MHCVRNSRACLYKAKIVQYLVCILPSMYMCVCVCMQCTNDVSHKLIKMYVEYSLIDVQRNILFNEYFLK